MKKQVSDSKAKELKAKLADKIKIDVKQTLPKIDDKNMKFGDLLD